MSLKLEHLPAPVADRLHEYSSRKTQLRFLRVVMVTAIVYAALVLVATHADRFIFLSVGQRTLMLYAVHAVAAACLLGGIVLLFRKKATPREITYEMESRLGPSAQEQFVTLENVMARLGNQPAGAIEAGLLAQLQSSATALTESFAAARLVRDPVAGRLTIAAGIVGLSMFGLSMVGSYQFNLMLNRFYGPDKNLPRASFIGLELAPGQEVLGKGSEAVVQVRVIDHTPTAIRYVSDALGLVRSGCTISIRPVAENAPGPDDSKPAVTQSMVRVQRDLYLFTKSDLQEGISFHVTSGNAQTAEQVIKVASQPKIVEVKLMAVPPAYAGLPPQTITDVSGPLHFLSGTKIDLSFKTDQAVTRKLIHVEKVVLPVQPDWDEATRTGSYKFTLKTPMSMEIDIANALGFANVDRTAVRINVQEDLPPTVRLDLPPQEIDAVTGSLVEFRGQIEDDFGVAETALRYVINPDPKRETSPIEIMSPLDKPVKQMDLALSLDLGKTSAGPGDTLVAEIRARDTNGTDSVSRSVIIHVVPFTRGGDEARRIAGLLVTGKAIGTQIEALPKAVKPASEPPVQPIDPDAYKDVTKIATDAGIELGDDASFQSILDLLESDEYLTTDSLNKADVRMIRGILLANCGPMGQEIPGSRIDFFKTQGAAIAADIKSLTDDRRAKNLLRRLSGMRTEATKLKEMLAELAKLEKPPADAVERINRRSTLYMGAVQDLGAEMIELSKTVAKIDPTQAAQIAGDINESGYLLSKGSMSRRKSAANRIGQQIDDAIALVKPALPDLHAPEMQARKDIESRYRSCLNAIAAGPPGGTLAERWYANAIAWLGADRLAMERDPFSPVWPRFVDFAMQQRLIAVAASTDRAGVESKRKADAEALLTIGDSSQAVKDEQLIHMQLSAAWRLETLNRMRFLSDDERQLELSMLAMEPGLGTKGEPVDPVKTRETDRAIAELASKQFEFPDAAALLKECVARAKETTPLIKELDDAMAQGAGDLPQRATKIVRALVAQVHAMQMAVDTMSMRMCLAPDQQTLGDLLPLRLKDALTRYRQRSERSIEVLAAAGNGAVTSGDLTEIQTQVTKLEALQTPLAATLQKLADSDPASDTASDGSVPAPLRQSGTLVRATTGTNPEAAQALLATMEGLSGSMLGAHLDLIETSQKSVADAQQAIDAKPLDAAKTKAALAVGRESLAKFQEVAARIGTANLPPPAVSALNGAVGDLKSVTDPADAGDDQAVSHLRFALGEWKQKLDALAGAVRTASVPRDDNSPDYQGGPERAWAVHSGYEAQAVRTNLKDLSQFALVNSFDALLSGPGGSDRAYVWAAMLHRLERSELAGVGVSRTAQKSTAKVGDPTLEFLKAELSKAKQQQKLMSDYSDSSKAYLDLIGDYLLY